MHAKKLKFLLVFFIALMAGVTFTACSSSDDAPATELSVDVASLTLSADGQSQTLGITSNSGWTITGNPGWLTVSPSTGSKNKNIVVTASENPETTKRFCDLRISTDDGQVNEIVHVEQLAKEENLSLDINEINIDGKAGSNGYFHITSNTSWIISGASNWVTLSSTNGNGTAQIQISANSDNSSASPRECTLFVVAGQITKQIKVIQAGLLAADCNVNPKTIVTLANGFAFDYTYGSNVAYYYTKLYKPVQIERMTDAEIIAEMSADINDRNTPNDSYVTSWRNLTTLTEYTVCTIGFDQNGNHGELQKKTLKTKSGSNQAVAMISDVKYNDTYWIWTTTTNGFVTRYYQWFVTRNDLHNSSDAAIAWFFNDAMHAHPDDYPAIAQGDIWYRERNGATIFDVVTWAVDVTGEFAGVIDRYAGQINSSSNRIQKQNVSKKDHPFIHYNAKK